MVQNYQNADCSLIINLLVLFIIIFGTLSFPISVALNSFTLDHMLFVLGPRRWTVYKTREPVEMPLGGHTCVGPSIRRGPVGKGYFWGGLVPDSNSIGRDAATMLHFTVLLRPLVWVFAFRTFKILFYVRLTLTRYRPIFPVVKGAIILTLSLWLIQATVNNKRGRPI